MRAIDGRDRRVRSDLNGSRRWARPGLLFIAVALIVVAAGVVRLADLQHQPGGLYPDEAAEGVTAYRILHDPGYHPLFIAEDAGREPLYAYLVVSAFALTDESTVTLRSCSAVLGILGVMAIGWACRRFGITATLVAMAWAAGSLWLICVARDGFRNILVPLVGALILGALIGWVHRPTRRHAIVAGAAVGLGLWTYQPLKLAPLLVVIWLWQLRRHNRPVYDAMVANARWCIGSFAVVGGPMIAVALLEPGNYFGRSAEASLFNAGNTHEGFLTHVVRTLGQFTFVGDPNARHDVAAMPLLGWPLFLLAVLGMVTAWRHRHDPKLRLLLLGAVIFMIPPLLAPEGASPHFLRNLGLAPYLGALIGIGAATAMGWAVRRWHAVGRVAIATLLAGGLVAIGAVNAHAYFSRPVKDRYAAYSFALVALARAANHGSMTLVIVDDYSAFDIDFLDSGHPPTQIRPGRRVVNVQRYARIVARSRAQIRAAAGPVVAAEAVPSVFDPHGRPLVFEVRLSGLGPR